MDNLERTISALNPNQRYVARVRAISKLGVASDWSEAVDFVTPTDTSVPNPPTELSIDFETENLLLSWTAPDRNTDDSFINDFKHFRVELISSDNTAVNYTTTVPSFTYPFRQNQNDYGTAQSAFTVNVYAVDVGNSESDPVSGTASNTVPGQPNPPTGATTPTGVTLFFSYPEIDIEEIIIERSTDNSTFTERARTKETFFVDSVDLNSVIYYYRIKLVDFFGQESPASASYTRNPHEAIAQTLIVAASNAPDGWKNIADFVGDGVSDAQIILDAVAYGDSLADNVGPYAEPATPNTPAFGIRFSPGTFFIEKEVRVWTPSYLEGVPHSTVFVKTSDFNGNILDVDPHSKAISTDWHWDPITISGIIFNENFDALKPSVGKTAVEISNRAFYMDHCHFINVSGNGLYTLDIENGGYIMNSKFEGCPQALYVEGLGEEAIWVENCTFTNNETSIYNGGYMNVENCRFHYDGGLAPTHTVQTFGKVGIHTDTGRLSVNNSSFESNFYERAIWSDGSDNLQVNDCSFFEYEDNSFEYVIYTNGDRHAIKNCYFKILRQSDVEVIRIDFPHETKIKDCHILFEGASYNMTGIVINDTVDWGKAVVTDNVIESTDATDTGIKITNVGKSVLSGNRVFVDNGTQYDIANTDTNLIPKEFYSGIELPENYSNFIVTAPDGSQYNISITNSGTFKSEAI